MKQSQPLLPGFMPRPGHHCRVCGKRLSLEKSCSEGIGPICKANHELQLIADMRYRAEKFGDDGIKKLLDIIERLKNEI